MTEDKPTALVLAAHPDDEALICGGTIFDLKQAGWRVLVAFFTTSDEAYYGKESKEHRTLRAKMEADLARIDLEYDDTIWLNLEDMKLGEYSYEIIQHIIRLVRRFKPRIIFTHNPKDFHIDHRTVAELTPEAVYQACREVVGNAGEKSIEEPIILGGDVDLEFRNMSTPDLVVPISEAAYKAKFKALKRYDSLLEEHPLHSQDMLGDWVDGMTTIRAIIGNSSMILNMKRGEAFNIRNITPLVKMPQDIIMLRQGLLRKENDEE